MTERFKECMKFVLKWEGGYSEHPNDPGGATMKGITQSVYNAWRAKKGLPRQHVKYITDNEVFAIYWEQYWQLLRCDDLPQPLDLVVFDSGVNCGVGRAARWLNQALKLASETKVTDKTLEALKKANPKQIAQVVCDLREQHYNSIATKNPKLKVFLKGWMNRLNDLRKVAGISKGK